MYPENLKYSEEHEWLLEDNGIATIGITDFAVDSLGDIVFIELPDKGSQIKQFTTFGEVTSGSFSPTLNKSIGLAYVKKGFTDLDSEVKINIRAKNIRAKIIKTPFYKRSKNVS